MADSPSTDYQSVPSVKERLGALWSKGLRAIRLVPYLTTLVALAGLGVFSFIIYNDGNRLLDDSASGWAQRYQVASYEESASAVWREFFTTHWNLLVKLMLPAFILAMIRQRGRRFLLALLLATLVMLGRWAFEEITTGWHAAHNSMMGEVPSPEAFYGKLVLITVTFLSLPLMFWLYHRSTILDRYVVRSFMAPFLMCLLGIIAIMITMDLLNNANDFLKAGFTPLRVMEFYFRQVPQILVMIMDAAVLLATLYTLSRMSRANEIISMLGSGRSLIRILLPILSIGLWASLIIMAMNYAWAPGAQAVKDEMLRTAEKDTADKSGKTKSRKDLAAIYNVMFRNREAHRTWFLGKVPNSVTASDMRIWFVAVIQDDGEGNFVKAWYGQRGTWLPNERKWKLYDAHVVTPVVDDEDTSIPRYDKLTVDEDWAETPWSILSGKVNPDFLSVPELASYLKSNVTLESSKMARYETTLYARFSLPLRCFLMVLLAAPLGIVTSRRGVLGGVAWAVSLFVIVYFTYTISVKLAESAHIAPVIGAWVIVITFAILGMGLLWMKNYNRRMPWG